MQVVHGMRPEDHETPIPEAQDFKTCPICGATCFADMDVCFGCLHHFESGDPIMDKAPSNAQERPKLHRLEGKVDAEYSARPSEPCATPAQEGSLEAGPVNERASAPFDHMRDIPGLKKPETMRSCAHRAHCKDAQDAMTSHHICSDGEGRQFEVSITVKLL